MPRFAWTVFCDDVRGEVGNKLSLMGWYDGHLYVNQFPALLPKFCFVVNAITTRDRPFQQLKFRIYKDEDLVHEMELDPQEALKRTVPSDFVKKGIPGIENVFSMKAVITLAPLQLDGPCYFKVRVVTEDEEPLRAGVLFVSQMPALELTISDESTDAE